MRHNIWIRLGVTVHLDDEEFEKLSELLDGNDHYSKQYSRAKLDRAVTMLENKLKRGQYVIDGDSYCPAEALCEAGINKRDDVDLGF